MFLVTALFAGLLVLAAAGVFALHRIVNDPIPKERRLALLPPKKVLAVFAHPDDEIMVSGSLAKWRKKGAEIHLLYLTHGEDGPTGGLVPREELAAARAAELARVQQILGAKSLCILHFPDRYLNTVPREQVECAILEKIHAHRPDTLLSFDNTIGLYGHTDHAFAGECAQAVALQKPSGLRQLAVMTLSPSMIDIAKKISKTFAERYKDSDGLPLPNCYVGISRTGRVKKQVCLAHKTQHEVVGDVQPYVTKLPSGIYYRVFSREYYHLTRL